MAFPVEVTQAAERSADPGRVHTALARLAESDPGSLDRLEGDAGLRAALVAVLGASRTLTHLCLNDPEALDVLAQLDHRPGQSDDLLRWKNLEYLRLAARDLTGADDLAAVGRHLARLAGDVLHRCWVRAGEPAAGVAVIAMGKLGGRELNYASDVDVLFVGDGDVRGLLETIRACFRVDVDLRPEGRRGPLVRTLDSYSAYWARWAQPWEFQALIKARPVAGPPGLGRAFADAASDQVWDRPFGADELRQIRDLKARAEGEINRRGLAEREIKRGRGGIRDIEFAVQMLQLVHGRHDAGLRSPTTLDALAELGRAGYVDRADAARLADAYRYLRTVEHRLQLMDGAQAHVVPADAAALGRLARVLGHRDDPDATAAATFLDELRTHQRAARAIHEQLFFRPLLELFAGLPVGLSPEAAKTRLEAFGFADADRTRQALQELTRGLTRASRLMHQMLPLLLGWLSDAPDPDGGLLSLRTLVDDPHRADLLVSRFRDSPETARRICLLLGTSRLIAAGLHHHPDLIGDLARDPSEGLLDRFEVQSSLDWRPGPTERSGALRRFKEAEELRVAAADVLDLFGPTAVEVVGSRLSDLGEAVLRAGLDTVASPVPLAVIAMGRLGGGELSYASDLDVLVVYDGATAADAAMAETAAEDLMRIVKGSTPAERVYLLDADLRPEGRQGPLARSLSGYATYYGRWAATWERQALLRARPVAGDAEVGRRFMEAASGFVWRPWTGEHEREVRRLKARMERERIPARDDPDFHLKLGRGSLSDVEWTVQLLQLRHGIASTGTMAGLQALVTAGLVDPADAAALTHAYRFCERTRNRLYLVRGVPGDALPSRADHLGFLARSLGFTSADLRGTYRRVTRRAREVTERLFYGRSGSA
jgi:[glutamine synthetase] adenylyltransferase / [glutamine synthetase]-adenylyl-L-tyrosine phosphorylase